MRCKNCNRFSQCLKRGMYYEDFLEWYNDLLRVSSSPLQLKTLRDTKDELFESWCYILKDELKNEKL